MSHSKSIAIVGGGPAGLRAAEVAAESGARVTLYDAKPSTGRKFLVAGKSGLNLTNDQTFPDFLENYQGNDLPDWFGEIISRFDNTQLRAWAGSLGIETYAASSGKVFPIGMKAAPLLRRWIEKLRGLGVEFKVRHRLTEIIPTDSPKLVFDHEGKTVKAEHDSVILALGGASWPSTGSDGKWVSMLEKLGIPFTPLSSANSGWETSWSAALLEQAEGFPLKNIVVSAGEVSRHGELVITRYGLEGGPIYRLGPAIRHLAEPHITVDFKPTFSVEQLVAKMESAKRNFLEEAKVRWKLSPAASAIVKHLYTSFPDAKSLAMAVKHCKIPLTQPRPVDEAISSAGGVQWSALTKELMLKDYPGIYLCGEMLDWEAPTGGYLLQASFATGTCAGNAAIQTV
ncbi:3-dehydro-bile acid delta(4,6)-reductase [Rubritalea halochordaticola]|uniref:3-dehydro-bile acid delta(4,6)-reductase n=1 Tax=Rubritalea halochordaticola TaxID=714537 RepID=A0ABP9UY56_9BACT